MRCHPPTALVALMTFVAALAALPPAGADDSYTFSCGADEYLHIVVDNAQVAASGSCGGQTVACSTVGSTDPHPHCEATSAGRTIQSGSGPCSYTGNPTPFTFTVTCTPDYGQRILDESVTILPSATVPPGPVGPVASVTVRDTSSGTVCVDVAAGGPATNVACVARALLGPADALIPRGTTVVGIAPQTTPDLSVRVTVDEYADPAFSFEAISLAGGAVHVNAPFGPDSASGFLDEPDQTAMVVTIHVQSGGSDVASQSVTIPYLGQVHSALASSGVVLA